MTKRKPLPTGYCPHCGVQYIALNHDELLRLAFSHVDSEHPAVTARYKATR